MTKDKMETYFFPMERDGEDYKVYLKQNSNPTKKQIRVVSQICGINYFEANRNFKSDMFLWFEGKAKDVYIINEKLDDESVDYYIVPSFKY